MKNNDRITESFAELFHRLSVPAMLVREDSQLVAHNAAARLLFQMEAADLDGQLWAGLDARLTLINWRGNWKALRQEKLIEYETDIVTAKEYLRPVRVEVVLVGEDHAVVTLRDRIATDIVSSELQLVEETLEMGTWSYDRLSGQVRFSAMSRQLLGVPEDFTDKRAIIEFIRKRMAAKDWEEIARLAQDLLTDSGFGHHTTYIRSAEKTVRLELAAKSVANALHVTHLFGTIRACADQPEIPVADPGAAVNQVSGELARFSIEQATDMIFWTGPRGEVFYVNNAVERILGYSGTELEGMSVFDFVSDFGFSEIDDLWDSLRRETSVEGEYSLLRKDGSRVDILAVVNYFRFGDQEYACSVCRNITARRLAQRRRRLTEFTLDTAPEMIIWSDPDGAFHFANETLLKFTGYSPEEFAGLRRDEFVRGTPIQDFARYWERLRRGERITYDTAVLRKDGTLVPVEATLNYLSFEGEEYNCVYLRDTRDEKDRERRLELSQLALDSAADCIIWLDGDLRVRYVNQTVLDLVGKGDWVGRPIGELLPNIDPSAIAAGSSHGFQLRDRRGQFRQLDLNTNPLEHDGETFLMLVGRDTTAIEERQRKLEAAYREIEDLKNRLQEENVTLREDAGVKYDIDNIITVSAKYQAVLRQVGQVANTDTTVLIVGETGTGKELLARAVHQLSQREDHPLVKVNCAALPASLIESELFGHEKGAFTGAVKRKKGRFELAHQGTIFLDEIGEMPLELQPKLLRALQEGEFERVGGTETIRVDVRLVAATNRDLRKMIRKGKFREDLYYRLNVFPIVNLPLRERPEDIPVLVEYFTRKFARRQGKTIRKINSADLKRVQAYSFPGNIRELENLIERSVVLCQTDTLDIVLEPQEPSRRRPDGEEEFLPFAEVQRRHIIAALKMTGGRITGPEGAGILLEMNDRTLMSKMRKMGIEKHEYIVKQ